MTTSAPIVARAATEINAPIALVFAILLDLALYPEWNPFIVKVTDVQPPAPAPVAPNSQFTLVVSYSDGTKSISRELVTNVTAPSVDAGSAVRSAELAYRYAGVIAGLGVVQGTRVQWMEQDVGGVGVTRYRTEEVFKGVGAALVPRAQVEDGFQRMAGALKARAEAMSQG